MKIVTVVFGIALVVYAAISYELYRDLKNQLEFERTERKAFEATTTYILHVFVQTLSAIEQRQTSAENIAELQEDLDLTSKQIRGYNAWAKLKRPGRNRNRAIGGMQ